ncbi:hypothetical protein CA830_07090 [Burkholderia multivorans]|nr:hypothetical protein CA831_07710 [Burkholderia multivorans]OXH93513.1 hypothetical protein CA830_07090 [Burkholderia multivorans]PRF39968.1 hypothetical protein C6Q11_22985 [Burkholderia multivorans]PRG79343.1 hypothetical protein C6T58_18390 [Burkholderia multivorans]
MLHPCAKTIPTDFIRHTSTPLKSLACSISRRSPKRMIVNRRFAIHRNSSKSIRIMRRRCVGKRAMASEGDV